MDGGAHFTGQHNFFSCCQADVTQVLFERMRSNLFLPGELNLNREFSPPNVVIAQFLNIFILILIVETSPESPSRATAGTKYMHAPLRQRAEVGVLSGAERIRLSRRLAGRRPAGRRRRATRSREDGDSTANRRLAMGVGSLLKQSAP